MFRVIPLTQIRFTARNPRSNPEEDLEELAASLGDEDNPRLAQFPLVEEIGPDEYRVIAGERRIRAAAQRGWQSIPCAVAANLDPLEAHALRIAENLHRKNLHPLDEAAALKIAWLAANADALGAGNPTRQILDADNANMQTIESLQALLAESGFTPNAPAIPWEVVLDQLGVSINPEKRKKLLGVLTVDSSVQEAVKALPVSEAGLRAIGRLEVEDQQRLVQEIADNPDLARKVRRMARVVSDGERTLDEALAEMRGEIPEHLKPGQFSNNNNPADDNAKPPAPDLIPDERLAQAVSHCLDLAMQIEAAFADLAQLGAIDQFPPPWNEAASEAVTSLQTAIQHTQPK